MAKAPHFPTQRGAALVEFAIVIPVILFLCFGIVEYGRTLSELTWASNAAYHAVVLGGESTEDLGPQAMRERVTRLQLGQYSSTASLYQEASFDIGGSTVKMALDGEVATTQVGWFALNYSSDIVGPWFAAMSSSIGNLNEFPEAPDMGDEYGCDGDKGSGDWTCYVINMAGGAGSQQGAGIGLPGGPFGIND